MGRLFNSQSVRAIGRPDQFFVLGRTSSGINCSGKTPDGRVITQTVYSYQVAKSPARGPCTCAARKATTSKDWDSEDFPSNTTNKRKSSKSGCTGSKYASEQEHVQQNNAERAAPRKGTPRYGYNNATTSSSLGNQQGKEVINTPSRRKRGSFSERNLQGTFNARENSIRTPYKRGEPVYPAPSEQSSAYVSATSKQLVLVRVPPSERNSRDPKILLERGRPVNSSSSERSASKNRKNDALLHREHEKKAIKPDGTGKKNGFSRQEERKNVDGMKRPKNSREVKESSNQFLAQVRQAQPARPAQRPSAPIVLSSRSIQNSVKSSDAFASALNPERPKKRSSTSMDSMKSGEELSAKKAKLAVNHSLPSTSGSSVLPTGLSKSNGSSTEVFESDVSEEHEDEYVESRWQEHRTRDFFDKISNRIKMEMRERRHFASRVMKHDRKAALARCDHFLQEDQPSTSKLADSGNALSRKSGELHVRRKSVNDHAESSRGVKESTAKEKPNTAADAIDKRERHSSHRPTSSRSMRTPGVAKEKSLEHGKLSAVPFVDNRAKITVKSKSTDDSRPLGSLNQQSRKENIDSVVMHKKSKILYNKDQRQSVDRNGKAEQASQKISKRKEDAVLAHRKSDNLCNGAQAPRQNQEHEKDRRVDVNKRDELELRKKEAKEKRKRLFDQANAVLENELVRKQNTANDSSQAKEAPAQAHHRENDRAAYASIKGNSDGRKNASERQRKHGHFVEKPSVTRGSEAQNDEGLGNGSVVSKEVTKPLDEKNGRGEFANQNTPKKREDSGLVHSKSEGSCSKTQVPSEQPRRINDGAASAAIKTKSEERKNVSELGKKRIEGFKQSSDAQAGGVSMKQSSARSITVPKVTENAQRKLIQLFPVSSDEVSAAKVPCDDGAGIVNQQSELSGHKYVQKTSGGYDFMDDPDFLSRIDDMIEEEDVRIEEESRQKHSKPEEAARTESPPICLPVRARESKTNDVAQPLPTLQRSSTIEPVVSEPIKETDSYFAHIPSHLYAAPESKIPKNFLIRDPVICYSSPTIPTSDSYDVTDGTNGQTASMEIEDASCGAPVNAIPAWDLMADMDEPSTSSAHESFAAPKSERILQDQHQHQQQSPDMPAPSTSVVQQNMCPVVTVSSVSVVQQNVFRVDTRPPVISSPLLSPSSNDSSQGVASPPARRHRGCKRCRNHGFEVTFHQRVNCPNGSCDCQKCRKLDSQSSRRTANAPHSGESPSSSTAGPNSLSAERRQSEAGILQRILQQTMNLPPTLPSSLTAGRQQSDAAVPSPVQQSATLSTTSFSSTLTSPRQSETGVFPRIVQQPVISSGTVSSSTGTPPNQYPGSGVLSRLLQQAEVPSAVARNTGITSPRQHSDGRVFPGVAQQPTISTATVPSSATTPTRRQPDAGSFPNVVRQPAIPYGTVPNSTVTSPNQYPQTEALSRTVQQSRIVASAVVPNPAVRLPMPNSISEAFSRNSYVHQPPMPPATVPRPSSFARQQSDAGTFPRIPQQVPAGNLNRPVPALLPQYGAIHGPVRVDPPYNHAPPGQRMAYSHPLAVAQQMTNLQLAQNPLGAQLAPRSYALHNAVQYYHERGNAPYGIGQYFQPGRSLAPPQPSQPVDIYHNFVQHMQQNVSPASQTVDAMQGLSSLSSFYNPPPYDESNNLFQT